MLYQEQSDHISLLTWINEIPVQIPYICTWYIVVVVVVKSGSAQMFCSFAFHLLVNILVWFFIPQWVSLISKVVYIKFVYCNIIVDWSVITIKKPSTNKTSLWQPIHQALNGTGVNIKQRWDRKCSIIKSFIVYLETYQ